MSKRGFRRIIVDGVAYRWKFPRVTVDVTDGWSWVVAQRVEPAGATARIVFLGRWHMSGGCAEYSRPVLPSEVAAAIRGALAAGWDPVKPGSTFRYFVPYEQTQAEPGAAADGRLGSDS